MRRGSGTRAFPVVHSDVEHLATALTPQVAAIDTVTIDLARALTELVRGPAGGFGSDQSVVASDLYRYWHLPAEPAFELLLDPHSSFSARDLAVFAVSDRVTPQHVEVLKQALCLLAFRASGLLQSGLRADGPTELLTDDERNFLNRVLEALSRAEAPYPAARLREVFAESRALGDYVRSQLPTLW
jgi:hypothetical protein